MGTDEIIGFELWRNIGLAMACVFVVTLILLANLPICLMVLLSVVLTLVDIVGFLHFWDITIDIISCVNIVLAIGLCVDYSVHIGLAFMVAKGSKRTKLWRRLPQSGRRSSTAASPPSSPSSCAASPTRTSS